MFESDADELSSATRTGVLHASVAVARVDIHTSSGVSWRSDPK
jgi:hypothetical protein